MIPSIFLMFGMFGAKQPPVVTPDEATAGVLAYAQDIQRERAKQRAKRRVITPDEEEELANLLRERIAQQDAEPPEPRELRRIRALVADYASDAQREFLTRRGQRAVEYAQRAQTLLALQLAAREIERFEEEAISAVLALALAD